MSPFAEAEGGRFEWGRFGGGRCGAGTTGCHSTDFAWRAATGACCGAFGHRRSASEASGSGLSLRRRGELGSRRRGRPSNNRPIRRRSRRSKRRLRTRCADFGATLARKQLRQIDGVSVSKETVGQIRIRLGLWRPKRRRAKKIFQVRERRPRFGEPIQIDGSPHDWLDGRGPRRQSKTIRPSAPVSTRSSPETRQAQPEASRKGVNGLARYGAMEGALRQAAIHPHSTRPSLSDAGHFYLAGEGDISTLP